MKIGVISDTHGHAGCWDKAFNGYLKDADVIIHAGDVLYHGPRNPMLEDYNPAELVQKLNALEMPLLIAKGNCDSEVDAMVLEFPVQAPYAYFMAGGKRIIATHGHTVETDAEKDAMAAHMKADVFISGHIHTTVLERRGNTVFLNPGSPSLSKREDGRRTCGVICLDEKTGACSISIYDIENGEELDSLTL